MSRIVEISQTPTVNASAYDAGDCVGGLLTFANAASVYKGSGILRKVVIVDQAKNSAILDLHLFNQTFTAGADDAAWDPSDADNLNAIGCIHIVAADWENGSDNGVATVECYFPFTLVSGGTSLFGQLSCVGTPTLAAINDITVKLTIER